MHLVFEVLIFSTVAFIVLFIFSKLMGKKQIAQLTFVDYVIGISIGSIAAEMATETETPFYYYIIAMGMFFFLDLIINFIERKGAFFKRILKGKPIVIIYEGKIIPENLNKCKLDVNDLLMLMRGKDFFDIAGIRYALFETNGTLSVIPVGAERPAVTRDLPVPVEEPKFPNYLIIDGVISGSGLSEINKTESWLYERLNVKNKKDLAKVLLASYDDKNDDIIVHYRD